MNVEKVDLFGVWTSSSMDGEGLFNWRFVFHFDYMSADRHVFARKKKNMWSFKKRKANGVPPLLFIQVWDNSLFHSDEYIGQFELPLLHMPPPAPDEESCDLEMMKVEESGSVRDSEDSGFWGRWLGGGGGSERPAAINLFEKRHLKGWWPCYLDPGMAGVEERQLRGKVQLELELLTEEEEKERPAGKGRKKPNEHPHLDKPDRPADSFLWFTSPWKTFRYIIWRHKKWLIIKWALGLMTLGILIAAIYYVPVPSHMPLRSFLPYWIASIV